MANVPVVLPDVSPAATDFQPAMAPYQRYIEQATGVGVSEAAQGFGDQLQKSAKVFDAMQQQQDTIDAKTLDNQYAQSLRDLMYGTNDQPGYYSKKGQDAVDAAPATQQQIEALRQKYLAQAKNPQVAREFDQISSSRANSEADGIGRYTVQERNAAFITTSQARIDSAASDAANAWNDTKILDRSLNIARNEVAAQMAQQGIHDPTTINKAMEDAETVVIEGTIHAAAQTDLGQAKAILDKYRPLLSGDKYAMIEGDMKTWQRAAIEDQNRLQEQQRKAAQDAAQGDANKIMAGIVNGDTSITSTSIANTRSFQDPRVNGDTFIRQLTTALNNPPDKLSAQVSAKNASDLFARTMLDWGDPNRIVDMTPINQAYADQKINKADFNFLAGIVNDPSGPDQKLQQTEKQFLDMMRPTIVKSQFGIPDDGERLNQYYGAQQYVAAMVTKYKQEGKNPFTLFQPDSPDYLRNKMTPFINNQQQDIDNMLKGLTVAPGGGYSVAAQSAGLNANNNGTINPMAPPPNPAGASNGALFNSFQQIEWPQGKDSPQNPLHHGPMQYDEATWKRFGDPSVAWNQATPDQQRAAFDREMAAYRPAMQAALGYPPQPADLYIAHQQGDDGAKKLFANPLGKATDAIGETAVLANGGNKDMTSAQFIALWEAPFYTKDDRDSIVNAALGGTMNKDVARALLIQLGVAQAKQ